MPLKKWASKMQNSMKKTYGGKKGTSVFWATVNKRKLKPDKGSPGGNP